MSPIYAWDGERETLDENTFSQDKNEFNAGENKILRKDLCSFEYIISLSQTDHASLRDPLSRFILLRGNTDLFLINAEKLSRDLKKDPLKAKESLRESFLCLKRGSSGTSENIDKSIILTSILFDRKSNLVIDIRREILRREEDLIDGSYRSIETLEYYSQRLGETIEDYIFLELVSSKVIFQGIYYERNILGEREDLELIEIFREFNKRSSKFLIERSSGEIIEYFADKHLLEVMRILCGEELCCVKKIWNTLKGFINNENRSSLIAVIFSVDNKCEVYYSLKFSIDQ